MNQTERWEAEGHEHWKRNFAHKELHQTPPDDQLLWLVEQFGLDDARHGKVLDVGCGGAKNLHYLAKHFNASRAVGTEVSTGIVEELRKNFPEFEFDTSDTKTLPYETDEFDIVLLKGVLVVLDRNDMLQALGECVRVCKRYLIHCDYTPLRPYSTRYKHSDFDQRVYKMDYHPLIEASRTMQFLGGSVINDGDDWNRISMKLYSKINPHKAFPLKTNSDFK